MYVADDINHLLLGVVCYLYQLAANMVVVLAVEDICADLREEVLKGMLVFRKIGFPVVDGTFMVGIVRIIPSHPQHRYMILDDLFVLHKDAVLIVDHKVVSRAEGVWQPHLAAQLSTEVLDGQFFGKGHFTRFSGTGIY